MSAKLIIFLAIVGATCALTVSPKYKRAVESSGSATDSAAAGGSDTTNSTSSASGGESSSNSSASASGNSGVSSGASADSNPGSSSSNSSASAGNNTSSSSDSHSGNSDSNSGNSSSNNTSASSDKNSSSSSNNNTSASSDKNSGASSDKNSSSSSDKNSSSSSDKNSSSSSDKNSSSSSDKNSSSSSDKNSSSSSDKNSSSSSNSNSGSSSGATWWSNIPKLDIQQQISSIIRSKDHVSILDLSGFSYLKSKLSDADYTNITFVAKIPSPRSLLQLPPIAHIRSDIAKARASVTIALGGAADLLTAVQDATIKALHAPNPLPAIENMLYTILSTYYTLAVNSPLYIGKATLLEEGMQIVSYTLSAIAKVILQSN